MPSRTLGEIQCVKINDNLSVVNMIAQRGVSWMNESPPIRYDALEKCLNQIEIKEVHMPRIGCGLAGGNWNEIEKIICRTLLAKGCTVYVYDL